MISQDKYIVGIVTENREHRIYICPMHRLSSLAERLVSDSLDPDSPMQSAIATKIIDKAIDDQAQYMRNHEINPGELL